MDNTRRNRFASHEARSVVAATESRVGHQVGWIFRDGEILPIARHQTRKHESRG
jgi:hypothetical protein